LGTKRNCHNNHDNDSNHIQECFHPILFSFNGSDI
jgi:hypothetical protein